VLRLDLTKKAIAFLDKLPQKTVQTGFKKDFFIDGKS